MENNPKRTFKVDSHLAHFDIPIRDFFALKPGHNAFIIGAFIFSSGKTATMTGGDETKEFPRAMLLQRAMSDSLGGLWEGPGGSCDDTDATVFDSVVREVYEETGLHVSRIRELVAIDEWDTVKDEQRIRAIKFSFWVEVHEANDVPGNDLFAPDWEHRINLNPNEHEQYLWVTMADVHSYLGGQQEVKFTFPSTGNNYLAAFATVSPQS
ncbi:hypothetical protein McanMca71_003013 [Microsporum canis]|uniref:NUDIX domain-containing protein n=1 Tax=Arthroderma otae (strain ATCC MYA-4605 / CBS 113480) TaxID=554155 RepID=C5G0C5_ARTOC|nr:NUDIX domain-containing protein [Microsporum canis CBS 113480]EEQ35578.1 NUDIX domain-containing protein [Microsporum canis CBS 113480]